jgi:archaemetzincin
VTFGDVDEALVPAVEEQAGDVFNLEVGMREARAMIDGAFDAKRLQYSSEQFLRALHAVRAEEGSRVLGITSVDLFIPMLSFVFGQSQLGGRAAIISSARLRQEFYELPGDASLTTERTVKEAIHELGHTFGLTHCLDRSCPMSLSTTVTSIDLKGTRLCGSCRIALLVIHGTINHAKGRL